MANLPAAPIMYSSGAVAVKNPKGEVTMQKVRVSRYVAGKRPDYAGEDSESSSSESDTELRIQPSTSRFKTREQRRDSSPEPARTSRRRESSSPEADRRRRRSSGSSGSSVDSVREKDRVAGSDARLRRLQRAEKSVDDHDEKIARHRRMRGSDSSDEDSEAGGRQSEEDLSDDELQVRRHELREKAKRKEEEELLAQEEEKASSGDEESEEEESEYEEYSEDEEDTGPRLKPVFVRKRDRVTLQETEKEEQRVKDLQLEQKRAVEERKRQSVKLVETVIKEEIESGLSKEVEDRLNLDSVNTDDENEELAYEQWKLRELKRIKRDKDEKETAVREQAELERMRNMTEEERRAHQRMNPRVVTNKAAKGKYKFLQKYYHRGAFHLEEEDDTLKQNFAQPTLEDHFDKTILPKIMQVKNFGLAGRTKYTHLVDQDTSDFNAAWMQDSTQNLKFFQKHAGGMRDHFDRPSAKRRKKN